MILLMSLIALNSNAQVTESVPPWFKQNMEQSIGVWIADNGTYKSKDEPFESYVMEWQWGVGKASIVGKLYALMDGQKTGNFWEFRQYWDLENKQGIVVQYGSNGVIGSGPMTLDSDEGTTLDQWFVNPDGSKVRHGHRSKLEENSLVTTSFDIDASGKWTKRRSYTWRKTQQHQALGEFSVSIAVTNIEASKSFYEKLGFKVVEGDIKNKWLTLKSGNTKVGLFQGFFPKNTLTFHPENVRVLYQQVKESQIPVIMANGFEKETGPASLMISDPDGNPILIDQLK